MKVIMKPTIELDEKEKEVLIETQKIFDKICNHFPDCKHCPIKSICDTFPILDRLFSQNKP